MGGTEYVETGNWRPIIELCVIIDHWPLWGHCPKGSWEDRWVDGWMDKQLDRKLPILQDSVLSFFCVVIHSWIYPSIHYLNVLLNQLFKSFHTARNFKCRQILHAKQTKARYLELTNPDCVFKHLS